MFFFFNDTATTEIYTLSLHDALPICDIEDALLVFDAGGGKTFSTFLWQKAQTLRSELQARSEEHTSELQSLRHLVCRLLLEKKNTRRHFVCLLSVDRVA